ncbi:transcription initiation factor tfiid subunit 1, partial [Fagus crenata]
FQAFVDSGAQQQLYQKAVLNILNYVSYKKSDLCQIPSIDKTTFQSIMSWAVQYTMGYELGSSSQDGRDEDDEEEYEDDGGGNRFLGFMFGNVDNSGDLDVD